jgi:3-methyl-2-oxobutanoate hydroxymethyltransferase
MAHIGFTPQSEHALGGLRVQDRGAGGEQVLADAHAVQEAGAFAVVLEMVPAELAAQVTRSWSSRPRRSAPASTVTRRCWSPDVTGLTGGRVPKFVKKYADPRAELLSAAWEYADDVRTGAFPGDPSTPSTDGRRSYGLGAAQAPLTTDQAQRRGTRT